MTRVHICDDSAEMRRLVRGSLEAGGDIVVVGEAFDGGELVAAVRESAADVIVLDISMPRVGGLQALVPLRSALPQLGIVVFSGHDREPMAARVLALGADRYLEKACRMENLRTAVRAAATSRRSALSTPA